MRKIFKAPEVKKKPKKVIAIDFDGVIHDHKNPVIGKRMGTPIVGAKVALELLSKKYEIAIFSVWGDEKNNTIADFMHYYELPYNSITNIKPEAEFYIDDKGVKFTNWQEVLLQI